MTGTKTGILDAAARLLSDAGGPMRCGDIAREIVARGLWATEGRTPECSVRAALRRDRGRGDASRLVTEGGMVGVRPAAPGGDAATVT